MDIGIMVAGTCVECLLCVGAYMDLRSKRLSVVLLIMAGILGIPLYVVFRQIGLFSLFGGVAIGAAMILVSYCTRGGIGIGDGGVLCITGLYLGFYKNIMLFFVALMLAAGWSVILLISKKAGRKTEIPFVPFLLVTHTLMLFAV